MDTPTLTPQQIENLKADAARLYEPNRQQQHFIGRLIGGPLDGLTLPLPPSLPREAVLAFVLNEGRGVWQVMYARTGRATFEFREIYVGSGRAPS